MKLSVLILLFPACLTSALADSRDDALFGKSAPVTSNRDAFASGEATDNPLSVGGIYYQRMTANAQEGVSFDSTPLSSPLQFDAFLDGRPNDRIRGYISSRLFYDPTGARGSAGSGSAAPTSLTVSGSATPQVYLNQAWLKFDIDHTVFLTIGKQQLRWGPSRFWNPTDFLNTVQRDPLVPYDLRLGNFMAKFHLPIESKQANLYAVALFDNPVAATSLGTLGGALRAEAALGKSELGIDAVFRNGRNPALGADLSTALGPFDATVEVACLTGATRTYQAPATITAGTELATVITTTDIQGPIFQTTLGLNYSFAWKENRTATVGVEYFYTPIGYDSPTIYPILIFLGQYRPFYTGKQYASLFFTAEGPDEQKKTSYTFSTLANLADMSFVSRLDFSWRLLTYLTLESFIGVHYGTSGGEFRFGITTPAVTYAGTTIPAINVPTPLVDVGLAFRVSL